MEQVKLGIIGCGGVFMKAHLPAINELRNARIVAICCRNTTDLDKKEFPDDVKVYTDWKKLLDDPEVEAVDISTPNYLHSIIGVEALKRGKHVLIEKPEAISVAEMQKLMDAEKESGKVFMAIRNNRFFGPSQFFKKYVSDGKCGEIYCARCVYLRRRGIPGAGGWFTTKEKSGGGVLIDLGIHMLDLAMYYMNFPEPVSVSGCTYSKFASNVLNDKMPAYGKKVANGTNDVEDLAAGFVRFADGACLQFEFSWASNIERDDSFVELRGDKGGIKFSHKLEENRIIVEGENGLDVSCPDYSDQKNGIYRSIENFLDTIQGKAAPDYTSKQGMKAIKVIEAVYESARTGKEVLL